MATTQTAPTEHVTSRSAWEGIGYGIISGIVFAVAEIVLSLAMSGSANGPFRMFASVVWGQGAFEASASSAFIVGAVVHLVLSSLFGLVYGLISSTESSDTRGSIGGQLVLGAIYGFLIWVLNFQIVARGAYPWFLSSSQGWQVVLHVVFFGIPLGLMYGAAERAASARTHRTMRAEPQPNP